MKTRRPTKKKPREIQRTPLRQIEMSSEDWEEFGHGVSLFNSGKFWLSHEAWEQVWLRRKEDERLFFQGLIQLAAAYHHLLTKQNYRGAINNFDKAREKLEVFLPGYLGVNVQPLVSFIDEGKKELIRLGDANLRDFRHALIPKMQLHKPGNPDLLVELREILQSEHFLEGSALFNTAYYWEAHEAWEEVWRAQEGGDAKTFVQAFVQMAAGYSFIKLRKPSSVKYLFEKAVEKFQEFEHLEFQLQISALTAALRLALVQLPTLLTNGKSLASPKIAFLKKNPSDAQVQK